MTYSRKDSNDSYNDETFGSTECSSVDRAEEERKRRGTILFVHDLIDISVNRLLQ